MMSTLIPVDKQKEVIDIKNCGKYNLD